MILLWNRLVSYASEGGQNMSIQEMKNCYGQIYVVLVYATLIRNMKIFLEILEASDVVTKV